MNIINNIKLQYHFVDRHNLKSQNGMAAIFTILVIGAAALIMARSAAFLSMSILDTTSLVDKGRELEHLTEGCVEESLRRLQIDNDYSVTDFLLTQTNGSCLISISRENENRVIDVIGEIGDYNKKIVTEVVINNDKILISKWNSND
jgi:hypothetical protein